MGLSQMMGKKEIIRKVEELVEKAMRGNNALHDAAHAFRVRDLAISLAYEQDLSSSPHYMLIGQGVQEGMKIKILNIIKGMGKFVDVVDCLFYLRYLFGCFKEEVGGLASGNYSIEFGVVQDADRLDAIGAIGIARCFTFGGSRHIVLHDPRTQPRSDLSKENYMNKEEQTTVNHFHEKPLKLKDLMKTESPAPINSVMIMCRC
ncbi:hypothetical protein RND71_034560 [Anisodus tanguticus]|uniref:Uncharacterized protein n=1 Tax=Anisodus tanguticus TaxID=243964 RepID=A0AAE1V2Q9_9SOLA|nr:hypothetical protein RND71_034560 [Anisodus tanguticus]